MQEYIIFTDSCGDLGEDMVTQLGVEVLPLTFTLDGENYPNYPDNRAMSPEEFYKRLRGGSMSSTSQINVAEFTDAFKATLEAGIDILYLAFSSGLSGTVNNAFLAAEELREKYPGRTIRVVDTLGASCGEGLTVWHAVQLKNAGKSLDEVGDWVEENKLKVAQWFTVDDLNFLKRGGRLSGAAAVMGTILSIKPVLHVDDEGHLVAMEKVRGRKAALVGLADHYGKTAVNPKEQMVFISHGDCLEDAQFVAEQIKEKYGAKDFYFNSIGPVIGSHSGPGTVALFFLAEHRN